jgi:methylenetetrahydrofolate reductase (NADPH)
MSFPASATEEGLHARAAELLVAGSLEISPRELHRAAEMAALLPKDTCVYIPSLPGFPLARTLEAVAAFRAAGLDPVPHVSARRILDRDEFSSFLRTAV